MQPSRDPQILALIYAVRRNPSLYDYRLPEYYKAEFNEEVWKLIAKECKMQDASEAKTYWKNLHHSFTVFYRNELIRLVRTNYDEQVIGPLPQESKYTNDERFGNRTWGYYSDMRFVAPFRIKGTDPELERLIELAKPIVKSDENSLTLNKNSNKIVETTRTSSADVPPTTAIGVLSEKTAHQDSGSTTHFDIPPLKLNELSMNEVCLNSFFDAMFRATKALPTHLQRRVKRELLQIVNSAEMEAEEIAAAAAAAK